MLFGGNVRAKGSEVFDWIRVMIEDRPVPVSVAHWKAVSSVVAQSSRGEISEGAFHIEWQEDAEDEKLREILLEIHTHANPENASH